MKGQAPILAKTMHSLFQAQLQQWLIPNHKSITKHLRQQQNTLKIKTRYSTCCIHQNNRLKVIDVILFMLTEQTHYEHLEPLDPCERCQPPSYPNLKFHLGLYHPVTLILEFILAITTALTPRCWTKMKRVNNLPWFSPSRALFDLFLGICGLSLSVMFSGILFFGNDPVTCPKKLRKMLSVSVAKQICVAGCICYLIFLQLL